MDKNDWNNVMGTLSTIAEGSDWDELMEPWAYYLAAASLLLIGFFGFFLNLFVIILMWKDVQLWTPMNIILFNLVCSDFLVSILGNPFTLVAALSHKWIFGRVVCIGYGFFMALLGITSITTLTVLAYERYCLVAFPISSRQISGRGAVIAVIFIWLYSFTLTTPPLLGWGEYVNEAANISCSVNWESQSLNATTYIIFLFIFGLVIPVIIILYSYINIILKMRQNAARLGRKNRAEGRVTLMVAVMIIAFLVAWTPYAIFALVEQFGPTRIITPKIAVLPALIAKSSICYNPLIYVGLNTQFRASWKRHIGKDLIGLETTPNQLTQTSSQKTFDCTPKIGFGRKEKPVKLKLPTFTKYSHKKDQNSTNGNDVNYVDKRDLDIRKTHDKENNSDQDENVDHEMAVFSGGKSILIANNSYHSNII